MSYKSVLSDLVKASSKNTKNVTFVQQNNIAFQDLWNLDMDAEELTLDNCIFIDFNWLIFNSLVSSFGKFNKITKLHISNTLIPKDSLAFLQHTKQLTNLCLRDNDIPNGFLDVLIHTPKLHALDLSGNGLISNLNFLRFVTDVTSLNLSDTAIHDGDLYHIRHTAKLERLFINDTTVTDACVYFLSKLTKLVCLDVSDTGMTAYGCSALKRLPNLTELYDGESYTMTEDDLSEVDDQQFQ
jgi:hypothetical protein